MLSEYLIGKTYFIFFNMSLQQSKYLFYKFLNNFTQKSPVDFVHFEEKLGIEATNQRNNETLLHNQNKLVRHCEELALCDCDHSGAPSCGGSLGPDGQQS